jgi:hypothetical protein
VNTVPEQFVMNKDLQGIALLNHRFLRVQLDGKNRKELQKKYFYLQERIFYWISSMGLSN